MADVAQIIYEHTSISGTLSFFAWDVKISGKRLMMSFNARPDGEIQVIDPNVPQLTINCGGAIISGDDVDTFIGYMRGSIDYSGAYPRLTTINLDEDTTITNIECGVVDWTVSDMSNGWWMAQVVFREKTC